MKVLVNPNISQHVHDMSLNSSILKLTLDKSNLIVFYSCDIIIKRHDVQK